MIRILTRTDSPRRTQETQILNSSLPIWPSFCPQRLGVYNVSKTALLGLTKTLAVELAPKNIRVNCLAPGVINTDFGRVVRTKGKKLVQPLSSGRLPPPRYAPELFFINLSYDHPDHNFPSLHTSELSTRHLSSPGDPLLFPFSKEQCPSDISQTQHYKIQDQAPTLSRLDQATQ